MSQLVLFQDTQGKLTTGETLEDCIADIKTIDKLAYMIKGERLKRIKSNPEWYREKYGSWENFCRVEMELSKGQCNSIIEGFEIAFNIMERSRSQPSEKNHTPIPTRMYHTVLLGKVEEEKRAEAWDKANEIAQAEADEKNKDRPESKAPINPVVKHRHLVKAVNEVSTSDNPVIQDDINKSVDFFSPDTTRIQARANNEYYTPEVYVNAARRVMGKIDLDPASNHIANKTIRAGTFYEEKENGLTKRWTGNVWLNPPYGREAGKFSEKLHREYESGHVNEAILLINSNVTDTRWFQPLWRYLICFTNHRIDFNVVQGGGGGSTHGSMFVYLGSSDILFCREFSRFGTVVKKYEYTE